MATYRITIDGVEKAPLGGFSLKQTANGRGTMDFSTYSADGSYRPSLDDEVVLERWITLTSSSAANPSTITTDEKHGLVTGQIIAITDHSYGPLIGNHFITVIGEYTFQVSAMGGGTGGSVIRRMFGGLINTKTERGLHGTPMEMIEVDVSVVDFNSIAERHYVKETLLADSLHDQLEYVRANYLASDGVLLHPSQEDPGPDMEELDCDYTLCDDVLNQFTVQADYPWRIDEFKYLRAWNPSSEACPFDITDATGLALGDISVSPSRDNYANRVYVRFSNSPRQAWAFLVSDGTNFANGETVTIGSKTYTYQTTLTDSDGNVEIGGTAAQSITNLAAAIRLAGTPGVTYAASTTEHPSVTAWEEANRSGLWLHVRAKTAGTAGNSIATTEGCANAGFIFEGGGVTTTLQGGLDQELTNVVQADDAGEQAAHGIWETVIDASEITNADYAQVVADAELAKRILTPNLVEYETESFGALPGQTQTITIADRAISGTFMITDVATQYSSVNDITFKITAIQTTKVGAVDRWRETYKEWSGRSSGGQSVGGVTITNVTQAGVTFIGGSSTTWQQTTGGAWVGTGFRIWIDSTVRGNTTGVAAVRIRARSGTVTARLYNVTDASVAGTSAAVSATAWAWKEFTVTLGTGKKEYEIELSPSVSDSDVQCGVAYLE